MDHGHCGPCPKKDLPIKHGGYVRLHEAMGMAKYCQKLLILI
jgi:hypothetical protein